MFLILFGSAKIGQTAITCARRRHAVSPDRCSLHKTHGRLNLPLLKIRGVCLQGVSTVLKARSCQYTGLNTSSRAATDEHRTGNFFTNRVAQNAQGVVKGVIKGVIRASFGRRAPLTPQLTRRQQGVAKRKTSGGSTTFSRWRLCTLVGDRHPVLKQRMTYECTVWVPLESYGEY